MPIRASRLELVTQAELQLPLRAVGLAFGRHLPEGAAIRVVQGRIICWRVEVGVVDKVEGLSPEVDHVIVQLRNYVDILLECDVPALEARPIDRIASAAGGECTGSGFYKNSWIEPSAFSGAI